jgi:hypothetical protein
VEQLENRNINLPHNGLESDGGLGMAQKPVCKVVEVDADVVQVVRESM